MPDLIPPQSPNACCGRWFLLGEGGKPEKVPTYSCFKVLSCLTETEMEILLSWTETRTTEDTTASSLLLSGQRFHLSLSSVVPKHLQSIFICLRSDTAYQYWCFFRLGLNRSIQRTGSRCHIRGGGSELDPNHNEDTKQWDTYRQFYFPLVNRKIFQSKREQKYFRIKQKVFKQSSHYNIYIYQ